MWSCSSYILIPGLDERAQNELYLRAKSMQALEVMEYEQDLPSFTRVKEYNQLWTLEIPRELLDTLGDTWIMWQIEL